MLNSKALVMRKRAVLGFSLIELMITISILCLLMMAVAPAAAEWLRSLRLRNAAELAMQGLQKTRAEAIKRNQPVRFWLMSSGATALLDAQCALAPSSASWVISLNDPSGHCGDPVGASAVDPFIVESYSAGKSAQAVVIDGRSPVGDPAGSVGFDGFGQVLDYATALHTLDFSVSEASARRLRVTVSATGAVRLCDRDVATPDPRAC